MIGENGLLKQISKAVLVASIQAEIQQHLWYEKHYPAIHYSSYSLYFYSTKTLYIYFVDI